MSEKTWNFTVIVSSASGMTKFLSPVDIYEDAVKLQQNAIAVGWKKATIYDSSLREVKEKPEER